MSGFKSRGVLDRVRTQSKARRKEKKYRKQLQSLDALSRETITRVQGYTMLNPEKLYAFIQAIRYVVKYDLGGDIVECGVWRGGAIMAAALTLNQLKVTDRTFYLYDTFSGMSAPSGRDTSLADKTNAVDEFVRKKTGTDSSDWCQAGIDDVRQNLAGIPYNQDKFVLVEGKVEDTIPGTLPASISILRLDTDWYESTRHEMEYLMPLLVPKGVLIIDDYYRWSGNQEAVDEYLEKHSIPMLLTKVGRSAIGVLA